MISRQEKEILKDIKNDFIEVLNFILEKTEERDTRERIKYLRYKIFFNNKLTGLLLKASKEEIQDFRDNLLISKKIIKGSHFNQVENLMFYLNGISKNSKILSIERIKEKETVACKKTNNKHQLREYRFAYIRPHLVLSFSSGDKIPILPFGKIEKKEI